MIQGLESNVVNKIPKSIGIKKVWSFIVHNGFKVPLGMLVFSLVPIQFLYVIHIIMSASLPGVVFGAILQENVTTGVEVIVSAMPHFIFEMSAFCLFASILFELNQIVRNKIMNLYKKDKKEVFFIEKVIETVKVYVILVIPIIIVASFMETYLADIISNLF